MISPLGDNISKVEMIDSMGSDLTVCNTARVSMDKETDWEEVDYYIEDDFGLYEPKILAEGDKRLIRFLARNKHISPFFHPTIQFRIKMPFFTAREWYRHEVGFARNEVSRRYVSTTPELYNPDTFRYAAAGVKQGSSQEETHIDDLCWDGVFAKAGDLFPNDPYAEAAEFAPHELAKLAVNWYNRAIEYGVAPEWARMYLPQNMYTEFVETGSLAAYARLYNLRAQPDAQKEVRRYAEAIGVYMEELFPESWSALTIQGGC